MGGFPTPERVQVGPLTYRITTDPREWEDADVDLRGHYGYTDHRRGLIFVDAGEASESMVPVILLHEIMHAAAFAAGQLDSRKRREEDWVVMVAPVLVSVLRDNPGLDAFLKSGGAR